MCPPTSHQHDANFANFSSRWQSRWPCNHSQPSQGWLGGEPAMIVQKKGSCTIFRAMRGSCTLHRDCLGMNDAMNLHGDHFSCELCLVNRLRVN